MLGCPEQSYLLYDWQSLHKAIIIWGKGYMVDNRRALIDSLASGPPLDGRYEQIQCINFNPALTHRMQGNFSLVFKAWDRLNDSHVAIKFFDPDPQKMAQTYRLKAFEREPEILRTLLNRRRCLQLVSVMKNHILQLGQQLQFQVPFPYFVVEWLDGCVDQYFQQQDSYDAITKLELFRDVLLAVEALHRHEVHHRDLKPDNLRSYVDSLKRIVVAIDLGTAARLDSAPLNIDYIYPVGLPLYSAPETYCGLAGHRRISRYTDYYALGCMLFELFSPNYYGNEARQAAAFDSVCIAMAHILRNTLDLSARANLYEKHIAQFKHAIQLPGFESHSIIAPSAVIDLLDRALRGLVAFDFRDRVQSLQKTRQIVDTALRVLSNEKEAHFILAKKREVRARRARRLREKEQRVENYLANQRKPIGDSYD